MNIYVGNLAYGMSDEQLKEVFSQYGDVRSAKIIKDRESGRSKGFGFVEMTDKQQGMDALEQLNGQQVEGRNIKVTEARPRKNPA